MLNSEHTAQNKGNQIASYSIKYLTSQTSRQYTLKLVKLVRKEKTRIDSF